jgi:uncharacterized membrane protein
MIRLIRFVIVSVVLVIVGIPFYLEKVGPNTWSGFRVPKTFSSPEIWYAANKTMGFDLIIAGIALLAVSLSLMIIGKKHRRAPICRINYIAFLTVLSAVAAHCFWALSRL